VARVACPHRSTSVAGVNHRRWCREGLEGRSPRPAGWGQGRDVEGGLGQVLRRDRQQHRIRQPGGGITAAGLPWKTWSGRHQSGTGSAPWFRDIPKTLFRKASTCSTSRFWECSRLPDPGSRFSAAARVSRCPRR
jgi:hypothetical protein